ncbi:MAG: STAS/SEC14 domain-containing protein [Gammaproteobacteria bacterium]|nr:STAS/SEC14 domain-containing protein [Gammaproteobacteria bacterium]
MLEFIQSPDDVVAVSIAERVTGEDLAAAMDRLDACLAAHDPVHVFVETRALEAIEVSGLGAHIARAMPLFGKLRSFGRVAVVADQAWVRAGTRIESALLPFVGYRVFKPDQRDEALAWVLEGSSVDGTP